jgi:hypothetical protein
MQARLFGVMPIYYFNLKFLGCQSQTTGLKEISPNIRLKQTQTLKGLDREYFTH